MNNIFIGSEFKLNVSIEPISDFTMDDYDFECEFYCYANRKVELKKHELIRSDENNYIATLDSKALGNGTLKVKIIAQIPDADFDDGLRIEVLVINTEINIIRS